MAISPFVLQPSLPSSAAGIVERFRSRVAGVHRSPSLLTSVIAETLGCREIDQLPEQDRLSIKLFFHLLHDLSRHGWAFEYQDDALLAYAPEISNGNGSDQKEIKHRLKASLITARNEQLREPSVRRFLRAMERPHWHKGRQVSVRDLFVRPDALAMDLRRRMAAPPAVRVGLLADAVKPYLQMATEDRDEFTGLRLMDIWRYCRYTWSIPQNAQPGRQMLYLVRDAAREFHPIIGIGALGSSVVQISCRDDLIGWSPRALKDLLIEITRTEKEQRKEWQSRLEELNTTLDGRFRTLQAELNRAVQDVYWGELVTPQEIAEPTEAVLVRLQQVADEISVEDRFQGHPKAQDLVEDAETPLYRRKRAIELQLLLRAKLTLRAAASEPNTRAKVTALLSHKEGKQAISVALRSVKKRHIGSSIMDITTCGALPPYGELLGGKLVALLMASPQVIADYQHRYANAPSEIASRMKGETLVRPPTLVLLGTTSLYYVGSSQYNRIRVPVAHGKVEYLYAGMTKGFGSVHLSRRTYHILQELLRSHQELREQSSRFAAGVNFKLRSIASGLHHLGLIKLQQHESPRLVYLAPLAQNWREYLQGIDADPEYLYSDVQHPKQETDQLIAFWKARWFVPRARRAEVLERLAAASGVPKVSSLAKNDLETQTSPELTGEAPTIAPPEQGVGPMPTETGISWRTLAELKEHRASFAERLTPEELQTLHLSTRLDERLVSLVQAGRRIYLTGNPGDGKTHILRRHQSALEAAGAFLNLDASASDENRLLHDLAEAIQAGRPAVVAVNEGPLRRMVQRIPSPDREQLVAQLDEPYVYGDVPPSDFAALLVNLGMRHVLSPSIVSGALDFALTRVDYSDAPPSVRRNRDMLARPRVRERLQTLLEFVARSGVHITMHELYGFLSFIITGGPGASEEVPRLPYYELMFRDGSPLQASLGNLDPRAISHPLLDMSLWDGRYGEIEWLETPQDVAPVDCETKTEAEAKFAALKRRFYFEARNGDALLSMIPEDHQTFFNLVNESGKARETAKVELVNSLSYFFGDVAAGVQENQIRIWTSLRYEVINPPTAFISSQAIPADRVHVEVPRLRPEVADLLEYAPTDVRLVVQPPEEGRRPISLNIDFELWLALMKLKRGMPQRHHDVLIGRRLNYFMSRLAAEYSATATGYVEIHVRDVELDKSYRVDVSLEKGKYLWA